MLRYFRLRRKSSALWTLAFMVLITLGFLVIRKKTPVDDEEMLRFRIRRFMSYQHRGVVIGPGENGAPVTLSSDDQKLADQLWKNASFNVVASDKISLDRSVPDTRRTLTPRSHGPTCVPIHVHTDSRGRWPTCVHIHVYTDSRGHGPTCVRIHVCTLTPRSRRLPCVIRYYKNGLIHINVLLLIYYDMIGFISLLSHKHGLTKFLFILPE